MLQKSFWRALPKSCRYFLVQKKCCWKFLCIYFFVLKVVGLLTYVWPFSGHETMTSQQLTKTATNTWQFIRRMIIKDSDLKFYTNLSVLAFLFDGSPCRPIAFLLIPIPTKYPMQYIIKKATFSWSLDIARFYPVFESYSQVITCLFE